MHRNQAKKVVKTKVTFYVPRIILHIMLKGRHNNRVNKHKFNISKNDKVRNRKKRQSKKQKRKTKVKAVLTTYQKYVMLGKLLVFVMLEYKKGSANRRVPYQLQYKKVINLPKLDNAVKRTTRSRYPNCPCANWSAEKVSEGVKSVHPSTVGKGMPKVRANVKLT